MLHQHGRRHCCNDIGIACLRLTVLARIAQIEIEKTDGIAKVLKTSVEKTDGGAVIFAEVAVYYGVLIPRCVNSAANAVKTALERYAAIYTDAVNITVKTLVM